MKRAFRDAWVAKLRSGEVRQGQGSLCADNKRCCLGVVYMIDDCGANIISYLSPYLCNHLEFDGREGMPKDSHLHHWGLSQEMAEELASLNDRQGKSFNEIAEYIEKYIPVED